MPIQIKLGADLKIRAFFELLSHLHLDLLKARALEKVYDPPMPGAFASLHFYVQLNDVNT